METKDTSNKDIQLTVQEEDFCHLYVYGGSEFAGQAEKCYKELFGEDRKNTALESRKLLAKPHVHTRVKELLADFQNETETIAVKLQITETLKAIMEETANAQYTDRFGIDVSPAPLRAVSVNAAKALMDLYPIKHVHESKLRIEGGDGNVIFNVIVPETQNKKDENQD